MEKTTIITARFAPTQAGEEDQVLGGMEEHQVAQKLYTPLGKIPIFHVTPESRPKCSDPDLKTLECIPGKQMLKLNCNLIV